ncbi:hypothetical protein [Rhodohalobacter sulfatireducens]|uniref:Carbohydrate-binding domain-containing protein n=1 Tax=Rhodohalobacter sulfatireducens TaxID=2911366 RepID=A0ABS9KET5_9BACT|nr:hypothetical protein [Rhodohalobacter sulfatireducens]MCG2589362.1 hypothetical protein [Rhodohalobacter sulfatireducens]
MSFIRTILLFILGILLVNCSGPEQLSIYKESQPLEIDGNITNWNQSETLLDSKTDVDYYAAIYDNNLYLFVDVKDLMKHSAITKSGLIVYLSNSENNRKRTGIAFPPGSYNLLREYPNAFEEFTTDMEWSREPENTELLTDLSEEMYSSVLIVERPGSSNHPEYGFVDKSQIEVNGIEVAANRDQRHLSLEMKIPLGESPLFNLSGDNIWLGFAIEPPDFNFRIENSSAPSRQRERYADQSRREANMRYAISRNLGQGEDWYIINVE